MEYNATSINFVVAMLTFSDQFLRVPSQETSSGHELTTNINLRTGKINEIVKERGHEDITQRSVHFFNILYK